jgi:anti-sigma28 factor (negative regulator of flagellin synthesis)
MKINPIAGQTAVRAYQTQRSASRINEYLSSADQVSLSAEVISFSPIISKIKEAMDTRTPEELAHIREITRQIKNGSYHVSGDKVASKIVDEYLNMK